MTDPRTAPGLTAANPHRRSWPLTVVEAFNLTSRRLRVRLVSEIDGFSYDDGQQLSLRLPHGDGAAALCCYSIHAFDAVEERLEIDFVVEGDSLATQWLRAATIGDQLIAELPAAA